MERDEFTNPHFTGASRSVATVKVEEFLHQCERMAYLVSIGEADRADAADCMHEIAEANGIYETFGLERAATAISQAFDGGGSLDAGWAPTQSVWDDAVVKIEPKQRVEADAPASTVEAFMYSMWKGVCSLSNEETLRRLSSMSLDQVADCCMKLQKRNPAWTREDIDKLISSWDRR